jgi:porin
MRYYILIACLFIKLYAVAQDKKPLIESASSLISECEWNMENDKTNLVTQLNVAMWGHLWHGAEWQTNLISTHNMRLSRGKDWSVADDNQVFSNIMLDSQLPLALSVFGITQNISERFSVFLGVRNLNVDYFTSPCTALFTNSSDGIFPTLADNWHLANYPTSAMCLHLEWNPSPKLTWKNSLYNGASSTQWNRIFRFAPHGDGIINVSEISFHAGDDSLSMSGEYHLGFLYSDTPDENTDNDEANVKGDSNRKKTNCSVFGLAEQPIYRGRQTYKLLLQGGYSPKRLNDTYGYFGVGLTGERLFADDDHAGVQVHRALYSDGGRETDVEMTYCLPMTKNISVQPALHFIHTSGNNNVVGLLRVSASF